MGLYYPLDDRASQTAMAFMCCLDTSWIGTVKPLKDMWQMCFGNPNTRILHQGKVAALTPVQIGVVFQTPSLLDPLTVLENVELPLLLLQKGGKQARISAYALLEQMDLQSLANKLPEELSGGQAQRVALARALICRLRLILADEPTGQLDHPTAERLFDVLQEALADTDTALVVATHDLTVARRMQTIWQMQYGCLEE